jgi:single-strand DNA-binding protein
MASVNKVILLGNCGRDPEMRYLPDGTAVASLSIATTSKHRNKTTGETTESTEWHRVKFMGKLAEVVGEYVKKGTAIYVEGKLKYGKYTKDGAEVYTTDIVCSEMQLLGGRQSSGTTSNASSAAPTPKSQPSTPQQSNAQNQTSNPTNGFEDFDEEIPF